MWLARRSIKTVTQFRSQFNLSVSKVAIRQNSSTLINLVEQSNKKFVADILSEKPRRVFTIDESAPLLKAIDSLVTQKLPSLLAVTSSGEISGVFTARDVLRVIHKNQYKDPFQAKVVDVMTKKEKMIFCRSTDSVSKVLNLMYQVKIRNIPVIDKGEVSGIITLKDLADSAFSAEEAGGKKGFMTTTKRKGIPLGTRLSAAYAEKNLSGQGAFNFDMDIASFALPHPYKRPGTVANNRRDYGAAELCTDMSLCEGQVNTPAISLFFLVITV